MTDNVNRPAHYTAGEVECIDALKSALGPEGFRGFCAGNAIKYLWRYQLKGGLEDLNKADWYLDHLRSIVMTDTRKEECPRATSRNLNGDPKPTS